MADTKKFRLIPPEGEPREVEVDARLAPPTPPGWRAEPVDNPAAEAPPADADNGTQQ